jgi:hypothetical protein
VGADLVRGRVHHSLTLQQEEGLGVTCVVDPLNADPDPNPGSLTNADPDPYRT